MQPLCSDEAANVRAVEYIPFRGHFFPFGDHLIPFRDLFFPFRAHFFLSSPARTSWPGDLAEKHHFHLIDPQDAPQAPATLSAALSAWKAVQDTWPVLQMNLGWFLTNIAGELHSTAHGPLMLGAFDLWWWNQMHLLVWGEVEER